MGRVTGGVVRTEGRRIATHGAVRGAHVDPQAQVRGDPRMLRLAHVDQPRAADLVLGRRRVEAEGELVELEQVGLAVDLELAAVLRDGDRVPGHPPQLLHLRVRLAVLDLADVEDAEAAVDRVGLVHRVAVGGDLDPVRVVGAAPDLLGLGGIGEVDRLDVAGAARHPEGLPVRAEAALVAGDGRHLGAELGVAAVAAHVVDVERAGQRQAVADLGREQAALGVEVERLVRRQHPERGEPVGLDRVLRIRHVEDDDSRRRAAEGARQVGRRRQRGVVVGADVALRVLVAPDPEAARRGVVADLAQVAGPALVRLRRVDRGLGQPPLHPGERARSPGRTPRAGPARAPGRAASSPAASAPACRARASPRDRWPAAAARRSHRRRRPS